ncbi:ATP-binding protein [Allomuricauda sp. CP2A]|uniref:tetratricopeptide repeat-containing sensor histidine kinase n=1 Tax=Allomuricauda sp. CP2A TaxID=1848189 RepID=UPI000AEC0CCA|nr:ATP-binding protein [Muricauda sp. CP2A]
MKKRFLIVLFIILLGCAKQPQKEAVTVDPNVELIDAWINTALDSVGLPMQERKNLLQQAKDRAFALANDSIGIQKLSKISLVYKELSDSLEFRQTNQQVMKLAEEANIHDALGNSHWDMAYLFSSHGVLDSAFYHYQKALRSFEQLPTNSTSNSLKGRMLYNMGRIQESYKDYLGAESSITAALKIFDDLEDTKRTYNCYNVLGIIASGMDNSEQALEYFAKASSYLDEFDGTEKARYVQQNQNNIAHELLKKEDYEEAKKAFSELLKTEGEDLELHSLALTSQAYSIFKSEKNYDTVAQLLDEAIKLNDSIGYSADQPRAKQYYAELLAEQGDTAQALEYAKESRVLAQETYNNERLSEVLRLLTKLDSENALAYSNAYYDLNETIQEEERTKRDKFARIRLETDQVIHENQVLSREKQIWIGTILGLILFGMAVIIILAQYINNNKLKYKQKQQESNHEIYNLMLSQQGKFEEGRQLEQKRISEELHDGVLGEMLGIRLILSGLNERDDDASVEQRAGLIERLQEVEEEIRTISHELNHASYEKFHNFIVSLEDLIKGIEKSSGIACSFTYDNKVSWDNLLGDIKINAYRIVQESLKNCVKHAQCEHVDIAFGMSGGKLKLTISDDGIGFDTNKGKRGIGLRNIISRVKKIKGTFSIDSVKGKGTTITVTIPSKYIGLESTLNDIAQKQVLNA